MSVNGIEVTDVIIFPVRKLSEKSKTRAFARLVINDQFIISGIKVMEGINGVFVRFPQESSSEGKTVDVCFPITAELRVYLHDQILSQYSINMNVHQ